MTLCRALCIYCQNTEKGYDRKLVEILIYSLYQRVLMIFWHQLALAYATLQ